MANDNAESSPFKHEKADDSAGFLLFKVTTLWQQKLSEVFGEFEITQTQYAILASLKWLEENRETSSQARLAEFSKIEKMTLSKSIRKLEDAGLVTRTPSKVDSRAVEVALTKNGKALVTKAVVAIENADDEFFSALTAKDLGLYKALTLKLLMAPGAP